MKASRMLFLGYQNNMKSYRFTNPNKQLSFSRAASFEEHTNWRKLHGYDPETQVLLPSSSTSSSDTSQSVEGPAEIKQEEVSPQAVTPVSSPSGSQEAAQGPQSTKWVPPIRYHDVHDVEPETYQHVLTLDNRE